MEIGLTPEEITDKKKFKDIKDRNTQFTLKRKRPNTRKFSTK